MGEKLPRGARVVVGMREFEEIGRRLDQAGKVFEVKREVLEGVQKDLVRLEKEKWWLGREGLRW